MNCMIKVDDCSVRVFDAVGELVLYQPIAGEFTRVEIGNTLFCIDNTFVMPADWRAEDKELEQ